MSFGFSGGGFGGMGQGFGGGNGMGMSGFNGMGNLGGIGGFGEMNGMGSNHANMPFSFNDGSEFGEMKSSVSYASEENNSSANSMQAIMKTQMQTTAKTKQLNLNLQQYFEIPPELEDDEEEVKPEKERPIHQHNSQVCKNNYSLIDSWLASPDNYSCESIEEEASLQKLSRKYLKQLSQQNLKILIKSLSVNQPTKVKKTEGSYFLPKSADHSSFEALPCDIGSRLYHCSIGNKKYHISGVVVDLKVEQLRRMAHHSTSNLISMGCVLKATLRNSHSIVIGRAVKNSQLENISDFLTQITFLKAKLQLIDNITKIKPYFAYDLLIFQDYCLFCCDVQPKPKQEDQLPKQQQKKPKRDIISHKIGDFLYQLQSVLQVRYLLYEKKYDGIEKYIKQNPMRKQLEHIHMELLRSYVDTQIDKPKINKFQIVGTIIQNYQKGELSMVPLISQLIQKGVSLERPQHFLVESAQSLNTVTLKWTQKQLNSVLNLINDLNSYSGFLARFTTVISNKESLDKKQVPFLVIRKILQQYMAHIKQSRQETLERLYQYYSATGDLSTSLTIQNEIISLHKNKPSYLLYMFQFYLNKKINNVSFDGFLYNSYIHNLEKWEIQEFNAEEAKIIEEQRQITVKIMKQIRDCWLERNFDWLNKSQNYAKYRDFIKANRCTLDQQRSYTDVLNILEQVYTKNLLIFNKQQLHPFLDRVIDEHPEKPIKLVNKIWLRMPLVKNFFYQSLHMTKHPDLTRVKKLMVILPAAVRHFSLFYCGVGEACKLIETSEGILKSNYLKFFSESESNFSVDLIILLQIMMRFRSNEYEHEKFRLQISLKSLDRFYKNLNGIHDQSSVEEVLGLIRITNELMFSMCRDKFMDLQKFRQKMCELLSQRFKPMVQKYGNDAQLENNPKEAFLNVKLFQCTLLLCQNKKKQVLPIIKDLISKYPEKLSIYYYFMKVKYHVALEDKKATRDLIEENLQKIMDKKDVKLLDAFVRNQLFMDDFEQILYGDIKDKSVRVIHKFSKIMYELKNIIPLSLTSDKIYKYFEHFLNPSQSPEEQSHSSFRRLTSILIMQEKGINFDSDHLHTRQVKYKSLVQNPFLAYPLFEALALKKVCLPEIKDNPQFIQILSYGLSLYPHCPVINQCWFKLFAWERQRLYTQQAKISNELKMKKITKKLQNLTRGEYLLTPKQAEPNWVTKTLDRLEQDQDQWISRLKSQNQMEMKEEDKSVKKVIKGEKLIKRVYKKLRIKINGISLNRADEKKSNKETKR